MQALDENGLKPHTEIVLWNTKEKKCFLGGQTLKSISHVPLYTERERTWVMDLLGFIGSG